MATGISKTNKNTIYNTIRSAFSIIYPLISFPYISRVLQTENIGKVDFAHSIVSYFSMFASLGISTYAIRECSKVRKDKDALNKTASEILSLNLVSTALAYFGLLILLLFARSLDNYRTLIIIQSSTILFTTIGADWINSAMEDFRYITLRTIGMQLLALLLMFIFVRRPEDYIIYSVITVVSSSGASIINVFYRRRYCKTRPTFRINMRKHLPPVILMFSIILSQTVYTSSDKTILGLIKGDYQVGLYSTAVRIYNLVNSMVASVAIVLMPQLSARFAEKDYPEINKSLKYALNYILVLGVPCICGIEIIAPQLICFIVGDTYIEAALSLRILCVALLLSFIGGWIGNMMFLPSGREKLCLISCIAGAVINIGLNLILIPLWGLNAAALTTAISEATGIIILSRFIEKQIHIDGVKDVLKAPLIGGVGIVGIGLVAQLVFKNPTIVSVVTIGVSLVWYFAVLSMTKNEFFLGFVSPLLNKLKRKV